MEPILIGLSDEETERLLQSPLKSKSETYARAEAWFQKFSEWLQREYPDKHLTLNAKDLTHVIGDNYKHAHRLYIEKYGATPPEGRDLFDIHLKPL